VTNAPLTAQDIFIHVEEGIAFVDAIIARGAIESRLRAARWCGYDRADLEEQLEQAEARVEETRTRLRQAFGFAN
jgi:hypothetical protein